MEGSSGLEMGARHRTEDPGRTLGVLSPPHRAQVGCLCFNRACVGPAPSLVLGRCSR